METIKSLLSNSIFVSIIGFVIIIGIAVFLTGGLVGLRYAWGFATFDVSIPKVPRWLQNPIRVVLLLLFAYCAIVLAIFILLLLLKSGLFIIYYIFWIVMFVLTLILKILLFWKHIDIDRLLPKPMEPEELISFLSYIKNILVLL